MIGLGVGIGPVRDGGRFFGGPSPSVPSGSNPNLLTSPNDFTNAAWVKSATTVVGSVISFTGIGNGFFYQATVASASGVTIANSFPLPALPTRFFINGTFDGLPYTFSFVLSSSSNIGDAITATLYRQGGFLRAQLADGDNVNPTFTANNFKLEQSSSFSGYP